MLKLKGGRKMKNEERKYLCAHRERERVSETCEYPIDFSSITRASAFCSTRLIRARLFLDLVKCEYGICRMKNHIRDRINKVYHFMSVCFYVYLHMFLHRISSMNSKPLAGGISQNRRKKDQHLRLRFLLYFAVLLLRRWCVKNRMLRHPIFLTAVCAFSASHERDDWKMVFACVYRHR